MAYSRGGPGTVVPATFARRVLELVAACCSAMLQAIEETTAAEGHKWGHMMIDDYCWCIGQGCKALQNSSHIMPLLFFVSLNICLPLKKWSPNAKLSSYNTGSLEETKLIWAASRFLCKDSGCNITEFLKTRKFLRMWERLRYGICEVVMQKMLEQRQGTSEAEMRSRHTRLEDKGQACADGFLYLFVLFHFVPERHRHCHIIRQCAWRSWGRWAPFAFVP